MKAAGMLVASDISIGRQGQSRDHSQRDLPRVRHPAQAEYSEGFSPLVSLIGVQRMRDEDAGAEQCNHHDY